MADQAGAPQTLQWARLPNGRFQITVCVQGQLGPTAPVFNAPIHAFILTQDEEDKLLASLGGITVARSLENVSKLALVK